ncbi:hypothetical protein R69927_07707 [Paraburkholderia domus]|uniref:DUF6282 family protein n=1 Tax=Paraburkholderia domus TaxID=2793075 RepID=UPI001911CAAD|nr:DUF6282 family protein [Paraburkholderia domus]MBK5091724.1 hypothetical protein [Burkholderia sp. R-69927]CAE6941317.1 hypothetical protein R69927_07707 [Paraburkholderia domus]
MSQLTAEEAVLSINPMSDRVSQILEGAIDMHCHSGPSAMPRDLNHIEAMYDAAANGMRAVLIKDHYYSATPITELLNLHFKHLPVRLLSGVPLNNTSGGFNPYAVDHGVKLGAKLVWMPTFSARNHIEHERREGRFPHTIKPMLEPTPLTVLDDAGQVIDAVKPILDMVAEHDIVLSGGHLHISEIFPLFEEARRRGVRRFLVNHPTYLIDASTEDISDLARMGVYLEHSLCMFVPESKFKIYDCENLDKLIKAATPAQTILGSDLGQVGNCWPAKGFRNVICMCLSLGYLDAEIKQMISGNPVKLLGLDSE